MTSWSGSPTSSGSRCIFSYGQFLLVDDSPVTRAPRGSKAYWSTFDSGLVFLNLTPKPAYYAFRIPIWLPHPHHGGNVAVWGQLRAADHRGAQYGELEFAPAGSQTFTQLAQVQSTNPEGFIFTHVAIPSRGQLRLSWLTPGGQVDYSRIVNVS